VRRLDEPRIFECVIYLVTAVTGLVFGGLDQVLGTLWSTSHLGVWTESVSLMSAPWLALPFLAGWRAPERRRAMLLGLVVTAAGLCGYFILTLSPAEGVSASQIHLTAFVHSQLHVIVPGVVTGPLFGWLGNLWRTSRSWLSATAVIVAFCGEPLVRWLVRQPIPSAQVATIEVAAGLAVAGYFVLNRRAWRRRTGYA
jgi:Family of unknown function (DUF6518)